MDPSFTLLRTLTLTLTLALTLPFPLNLGPCRWEDRESESPDIFEREEGEGAAGAGLEEEDRGEFPDLEALIQRRKREITARLEAKREKEKLDETWHNV